MSRARLQLKSSRLEKHLEHGQNIPRAWSNFISSSSNPSSCTVETCLGHSGKISGARSKYISSTVDTSLEYGQKNNSRVFEAYLECGRNKPRARSKHTSSTVEETYLKHSRTMARARSKDTSSTIETFP